MMCLLDGKYTHMIVFAILEFRGILVRINTHTHTHTHAHAPNVSAVMLKWSTPNLLPACARCLQIPTISIYFCSILKQKIPYKVHNGKGDHLASLAMLEWIALGDLMVLKWKLRNHTYTRTQHRRCIKRAATEAGKTQFCGSRPRASRSVARQIFAGCLSLRNDWKAEALWRIKNLYSHVKWCTCLLNQGAYKKGFGPAAFDSFSEYPCPWKTQMHDMKKKMRACWFASFEVSWRWFQDMKNPIRPYSNFGCREVSGKLPESCAMFWIHGHPLIGRDQSLMAREMCRKPLIACVRFFGCIGFVPGIMDCKYNCRNVEASPANLSTVFRCN